MAWTFSASSQAKLDTVHPALRLVMKEAIQHWDFTILEGKRSIEQQAENVRKGVSKTMDSRHLDEPARAVDAAPWPLKWPDKNSPTYAKDLALWYYFGGYVLEVARKLGIPLRWGGDWDQDRDIHDQNFDDLPHFELPKDWP